MLTASQETVQLLELELPPRLEDLQVPALEEASIHLWHANPVGQSWLLPHFSTLLSADEEDRRARFHFEGDRQDFTFARGMLRILLGAYLEIDPRAVGFEYSEHGKPALADGHQRPELQFNVSRRSAEI